MANDEGNGPEDDGTTGSSIDNGTSNSGSETNDDGDTTGSDDGSNENNGTPASDDGSTNAPTGSSLGNEWSVCPVQPPINLNLLSSNFNDIFLNTYDGPYITANRGDDDGQNNSDSSKNSTPDVICQTSDILSYAKTAIELGVIAGPTGIEIPIPLRVALAIDLFGTYCMPPTNPVRNDQNNSSDQTRLGRQDLNSSATNHNGMQVNSPYFVPEFGPSEFK